MMSKSLERFLSKLDYKTDLQKLCSKLIQLSLTDPSIKDPSEKRHLYVLLTKNYRQQDIKLIENTPCKELSYAKLDLYQFKDKQEALNRTFESINPHLSTLRKRLYDKYKILSYILSGIIQEDIGRFRRVKGDDFAIPDYHNFSDLEVVQLPKVEMYDYLEMEKVLGIPILLLRANSTSKEFVRSNFNKVFLPNPIFGLNTPQVSELHLMISCILDAKSWFKIPLNHYSLRTDPLSVKSSYPIYLLPDHSRFDGTNDATVSGIIFNVYKVVTPIVICLSYYVLYRIFIQNKDFDRDHVNKKVFEDYILYRFKKAKVPLDLRYSNLFLLPESDLLTALQYRIFLDPEENKEEIAQLKEVLEFYYGLLKIDFPK